MQSLKVIISLFLIGCALALDTPQAEQRVDLTDLNGVPSINAKDLKLGQEFGADVKSKADVNAYLNKGGSQSESWKVGVSDDKATAGQHSAGYKQTEGDNSYSASNSNGESGSIKTGQDGGADTFSASDNIGGSVNGDALKTGVDFGKVSGQVDGSKPWDGSWDGTFARASENGNQVYAKKVEDANKVNFDLRGPGERGTAYMNKNEDTVGYKDNKGWFGKEVVARVVEDNDERTKTEVSNKFGSFSNSKYIVETDNTKNTASLSNNNGQIAEAERIRATEGPCDEDLYSNKFSKDQFKIDEDSVKVEIIPIKKANGELSYEWPSCMDVSMMVTLPEGIDVNNLAAQVEVSLPLRQKFQCAKQYKCGSYECFYKDLCNDQANAVLEKTVAVNEALSNADSNACNAQNGRKLPLRATVCPADDATLPVDEKAIATNLNLLEKVYEDVEATIKLYDLKPNYQCANGFSGFFSQMFNRPTQVACRKASISYKVTFQNSVLFSNRDLNLIKEQATTEAPVACDKSFFCKFLKKSNCC